MILQLRLWALPKTQEGTTEHFYNKKKDVFTFSLKLFQQQCGRQGERMEKGTETTQGHTGIIQGGNEENLHYVNENSQERMAQKTVFKVGMYTIPYLSIWIRICNQIAVNLIQQVA